jgi:para-aminobenzoate synthetase component 1
MNKFELDITITHEMLLKITALFAEEEGTCLLYSGGNLDSAHKSFLFLFPFSHVEIHDEKNAWDLLKNEITLNSSWVGFLTYEMGLESHGITCLSSLPLPKAYFQQSVFLLVVDHQSSISTITIREEAIKYLSEYAKKWILKLSDKKFWESFTNDLPAVSPVIPACLTPLKNFDTLEKYVDKVLQIQEMINDGEVYQVNLSHEAEILAEHNSFSLFAELMQINPSPFAAYFKHENFTIVSSSPERFLKKSNDQLETRPIKGTISRGMTLKQDLENRDNLLHSKKDLSELVMITDLMRNDLGKISLPGSVKTLKIAHLEAYTNVYHLLSIIQSVPFPSSHPLDIVKACFPGGSITGCPKFTSMKVIQKLENRARGIYTGSIGYFDENGDFDFNIAIRTLLFYQNKINIQLGGAITTDSIAKDEYKETLQKGASIFQSLT